MDKLKMRSPDMTERNIERIGELLPSVITERLDDEGHPVRAIDFDLLRQELSDHVVEGPQERYQLDWPGKREALFAANAPIAKTLRPVRDESVEFDTTQNLFIEGDNLEALKLLQESYLGKVKLIYIDPPYNTGSDLIYDDDYAETTVEYLERSGQTDGTETRLISNLESKGRFHSDWLSMIYPRLKLARNLLAEDGAMFISIDDHEAANLTKVCLEIFGSGNVETIVWHKVGDDSGRLKVTHRVRREHEYIVICYRNVRRVFFKKFLSERNYKNTYSNPDDDPRGPYKQGIMSHTEAKSRVGGKNYYSVTTPSGKVFSRQWRMPQHEFADLDGDGRIYYGKQGDSVPSLKVFINELGEATPTTIFTGLGTAKSAGLALAELFDGHRVFDYPKPVELLRRIIAIATEDDSTILDFFAGSGTTAQAALEQNAEDGGTRRFVLVQGGEAPAADSVAASLGYKTIAAIARERIIRASRQAKSVADARSEPLDVGFRMLRVDTTNIADVLRTPDETDQGVLGLLADNVKPDRSGDDLLVQVLLDWGLELTMPIGVEKLAGHEVFVVEDSALIACFDDGVSLDLIKGIAERRPLRAVFRDSGFDSDDARINAEQIFKEISPSTDVKAI